MTGIMYFLAQGDFILFSLSKFRNTYANKCLKSNVSENTSLQQFKSVINDNHFSNKYLRLLA